MDKIIISTIDQRNRRPIWAIHEMVTLLIREGVPTHDIHNDALRCYYLAEYVLPNFYHYGYADLLFKSKGDLTILKAIQEVLHAIGAHQHLLYVQQQEKVVATLPKEDYEQWLYMYPAYGLIDSKLLKTIQGKDHKEISQKEDLNALAYTWLNTLPHFEVRTFKEKYNYLSQIANKPLMPISAIDLKAYEFLIDCSEQQEIPFLLRLCDIELYGEIEKVDHYEWFPDADLKAIDTHIDALYEIGVDGGGGSFVLWYYPDMTKVPAVIFSDGHGEFEFLAPTFSDYILTMPKAYGSELSEDTHPLGLKEKLLHLKEKLNLATSNELKKDLNTLREEEETIQEQDAFWQKNWSLDDFLELCDDYEDEFEKEIQLKDMMQVLHDRLSCYLEKAEPLFSASDKDLYIEEKKRFHTMMQALEIEI